MKRLLSHRLSHTKSHSRRVKHTSTAHVADLRINHSAMVLTIKKAALTNPSSLFLKVMMKIPMKNKRLVSAVANITNQRVAPSVMAATRMLSSPNGDLNDFHNW